MSNPSLTADVINSAQQVLNNSYRYELPVHYQQNYQNQYINHEFTEKLRELYNQYNVQPQVNNHYSHNQAPPTYHTHQPNYNTTSTPTGHNRIERHNRIEQFKELGNQKLGSHRNEMQNYLKKNRNNQRSSSVNEMRFNTENMVTEDINESVTNEDTIIYSNKKMIQQNLRLTATKILKTK